MDEDTIVEVKIVNKDEEGNPTGQQVVTQITMRQLADLVAELNAA